MNSHFTAVQNHAHLGAFGALDQEGYKSLPHLFLTGAAGHGKDTIGDYLIDRFGYARLSVSDGIREEISMAYTGSPEAVTPEWQNERDLKNVEQGRLALKFCSDQTFVKIALKEFEREDQDLFDRIQAGGLDKPKSDAVSLGHSFADTCFTPTARMELPRSPRRIQQVWGTEYRRCEDPDYWLKYAEKNADFSDPKVLTSTRYPNELEFGDRIGGIRLHIERPGHREAAAHITEEMLPLRQGDIVILNDGSVADLLSKVEVVMAGLTSEIQSRKRARVATP